MGLYLMTVSLEAVSPVTASRPDNSTRYNEPIPTWIHREQISSQKWFEQSSVLLCFDLHSPDVPSCQDSASAPGVWLSTL